MGSLGGDLLRMLVASGVQMGANVGSGYLLDMLKQKQVGDKATVETLLEGMGNARTPEEVAQYGEILKKYKVDLSTGKPAENPAVVEITDQGRALTAPKSTPLSELAPGTQTTPGYVQPPPNLNALKARIFQRLSPAEQKAAAFPQDTKHLEFLTKLQDTKEGRAERNALLQYLSDQSNETRRMIAESNQAMMGPLREMQMGYLESKMKGMETEAERKAMGDENKVLMNLNRDITMAPDSNTRKQLMAQANEFIKNSKYHQQVMPFTETIKEGGFWGIGGTKKNVPIQSTLPTPTTKTAAPAVVTPDAAGSILKQRGYIQNPDGTWTKPVR